MALSQNIGVPWIMCQQYDAPDNVVMRREIMWKRVEVAGGGVRGAEIGERNKVHLVFQNFGTAKPHRPPEDIAFAVARFFQKGGSLQNYYMYHGGTNFGRTSGGPFITTSYDYDAPIDEYGVLLSRFSLI
ncbi:hypothetical protein GW17_00054613 [Ensete ventricosum]|nr:hypothetical protein GW17_00054613 [Ensete ventricosum]